MSAAALGRISSRAAEADKLIAYLSVQVSKLKAAAAAKACKAEEEKLSHENEKLKIEVERLKQQLISIECENGVPQITIPKKQAPVAAPASAKAPVETPAQQPAKQEQKPKEQKKQAKENKKQDQKNKGGAKAPADAAPVDVSRLDMRVGLIRSAIKHPDADTLYVEEVDLGEEKPRTIVSGIVKFVPLEKMQQRLAIFTCNLKPAKMRGILSEGMIMCGSSPEIVEIIEPPAGAAIGDRISVEGYEGNPDALLNPKKKIFEQVQPDLRIDAHGVATYKGVPWNCAGKGKCSVPTMRDTIIK